MVEWLTAKARKRRPKGRFFHFYLRISKKSSNFAAGMNKLAHVITAVIDFFQRPFDRWVSKELFRYAACGGGNLVFDWLLYFLIYNFVIGHEIVNLKLDIGNWTLEQAITPHIATLCIVFPITLLTGFWLQKYVTFTQSNLHGARQLVRYILVVLINLAVNYYGLKLCVETLGWYPTPSKMVITIVTVIISYFCQKYFTFKVNK
jgi:putative flippase GtrA